jgi:hypothetical protein
MSRVPRTIALASVLLGLVPACAKQAPTPSRPTLWDRLSIPVVGGKPDLSRVEIELDRGECCDECPSYGVILRGDDDGLWTGRAYVRVMGEQPIYFEHSRLASVLEKCERLGLANGGHACTLRDGSSTLERISLDIGGKRHEVINQMGESAVHEPGSAEWRWHALASETAAEIDSIAGSEGRMGTVAEQRRNRPPLPSSK